MPSAASAARRAKAAEQRACGEHPRPPGGTPAGYEWNSLTGEWLDAAGLPRPPQQRQMDNAAHRHAPGHRARSATARRARAAPRHRRGRTALQLLAMDADAHAAVGRANVGELGACSRCCHVGADPPARCSAPDAVEHKRARLLCTHCGALLFAGEAVKTEPHLRHKTCWRGRFCCGNGSVDVPRVRRSAAIDALYADAETGNLLREHGRRINNALALASAKCKTPAVPGPGFNPTVSIQGKLYHRVGPLDVQDGGTPQFAQIYVHDPAEDKRTNTRYAGMEMPTSTPKVQADRLKRLLRELEAELRGCNTYVLDFLTAAEVFASEDVTGAQFVLDADQRPGDAQRGQYDGSSGRRYNFSEVCVLAAEV